MPWIAALAAVGGQMGSTAIGAQEADSQLRQEQTQFANAVQQFTQIGVPPAQATQIVFQQFKNSGQMSPQLESAITQGNSALNDIQTNPQNQIAQLNALNQLQQIGSDGGMNLSDRAALNQSMSNIATQNRGAQQAILQNAAARGQAGSGVSLAAQLDAQQGSANQAQQQGLNVAGQAQQRALQSIMNAGTLGGQMENQQFNEGASKAAAQDAINRFNTQNRQNVGNYNVGAQNASQLYNLQNSQNLMNMNTQGQNSTNQWNAQQIQQNYQDQLAKASGASGQYQNMGNYYGNQAANTQNMWSGIGQGLGQAGTAVGSYFAKSNQNQNQQQPTNGTQWAGTDENDFGGAG